MAQKRTIIDIGSWSVKVLTVSNTLMGASFESARALPVEGRLEGRNRERETQKLLRELTQKKLAGDAVTVGVPAERLLHRRMEVPFSQRSKIDSTLLFELEQVLPSQAEDVTCDYLMRRRKGGGAELFVSVLPVAYIQELLSVLDAGRMDPRFLPDPVVACLSLEPAVHEAGEADAVLLLDLGHVKNTAVVVQRGRVLAHRVMVGGGLALTRAMSEAFSLPLEEAEKRKHSSNLYPAGAHHEGESLEHRQAAVLREAQEPLVRELVILLHELPSDLTVSVKIFGGGAKLRGVDEFLRQRLGLKCDVLEPGGLHLASPVELEDPSWVPGLALGLNAAGRSSLACNLRRLKHPYIGDFRYLQGRLAYLGFISSLLALTFLAPSVLEYRFMTQRNQGLLEQIGSLSEQVLGQRMEDYDEILDAMSTVPKPEVYSVFPDMTALETFFEVENLVASIHNRPVEARAQEAEAKAPEEDDQAAAAEGQAPAPEAPAPASGVAGLRMNKILIDMTGRSRNLPGKVEFSGDADSVSTLEFFEAELGRHPCFHNVTRSSQQVLASDSERMGWQRFALTFGIGCPKASEKLEREEKAAAAADQDGGEKAGEKAAKETAKDTESGQPANERGRKDDVKEQPAAPQAEQPKQGEEEAGKQAPEAEAPAESAPAEPQEAAPARPSKAATGSPMKFLDGLRNRVAPVRSAPGETDRRPGSAALPLRGLKERAVSPDSLRIPALDKRAQ